MLFTKRVPLWSREPLHITFVNGKTYAPPTLVCEGNCIRSTHGIDFHTAMLQATSPDYVCKAVLCALEALRLMHNDHIWHLDAKAKNFVICNGCRHAGKVGPTDFTHNGTWWCVVLIDYETLFAPLHVELGFSKDLFNQDARVLASLGRKTFDEMMAMPPWKRNRADVYSFASSLLHGPSQPATDALQRAAALAIGHIPVPAYYDNENNERVTYCIYLANFDLPVATVDDAQAHVARVHLPDTLLAHTHNTLPPKPLINRAAELCNNSHTVLDNALEKAGMSKSDRIAIFTYLHSQ